jgi:ATP-binding cassette subfamily B protein
VLDNLSFSIAPGSNLAIVGQSGAGKTTLAMLLLGFYQPCAGQIRIGDRRLQDWPLTNLRRLSNLATAGAADFKWQRAG